MFGSGMVAGPAVDKLAERSDVRLVIGGLFIFSVLYHAFLNFRSQLATPAWRWRSFVAIITMYSTVKLIMGKHADVSRLVEESDVVIRYACFASTLERCVDY